MPIKPRCVGPLVLAVAIAACGDGGSDSDPAPGPTEFQVNTYTLGDQKRPVVTSLVDGDVVVAWNSVGQDGDGSGAFAKRYTADLTSAGEEFHVNVATLGEQTLEAIAPLADGGFVVAWRDGATAMARRYDADGVPADPYEVHGGFGDATALDGSGRFVVAFEDSCSASTAYGSQSYDCIRASRTAPDGTLTDAPFQVGTGSYDYLGYLIDQERPAVAANLGGDFVVIWNEADFYYGHHGNYDHVLYGRGFDADASPETDKFRAGSTGYFRLPGSTAVSDSGEFVVVSTYCSNEYESYQRGCYYSGIGGSRGAIGGSHAGFNVVAQKGYFGREYADDRPSAAINDVGAFVVVWERTTYESGETDVMTKLFDAAGEPTGGAYAVHAAATSAQCCARAVRSDDGSIVVVWQAADGDGTGVFARRLVGDSGLSGLEVEDE